MQGGLEANSQAHGALTTCCGKIIFCGGQLICPHFHRQIPNVQIEQDFPMILCETSAEPA